MQEYIWKKIAIIFIFFGLSGIGFAQDAIDNYSARASITPMFGYQFGGSVRYVEGDLNIRDNGNIGAIFSFQAQYDTYIELSYSFMETEAYFRSYTALLESREFAMDVHYILLNGLKEFTQTEARPFGLLGIGAVGFVPQDLQGSSSFWSFGVMLGAGVKYMITPRIGIRAQGRLLMPLRFSGFGIYAGTGGAGVNTYSTVNILQGDFSGGLIIAF
jgi:opacity protein-like surface antigen